MQAYRTETTIAEGGEVTLRKLPFAVGEEVEVIVLPRAERRSDGDRYPLRGTPLRFENPTEPASEADWEALG